VSTACLYARARGVAELIAMGIKGLPKQRIVEPRMRTGKIVLGNTRMKRGFILFVVIVGRRIVKRSKSVIIEMDCTKR